MHYNDGTVDDSYYEDPGYYDDGNVDGGYYEEPGYVE